MNGLERLRRFGVAGFGSHFLVFVAVSIVSLVLAAATDWRWLYWVPAGWGVLLLIHYLVYKASTVAERRIHRPAGEPRPGSNARIHIEGMRSDQTPDPPPDSGGRDRRPPRTPPG